jgi:GNAT superfamily N-acetyltransferase
MRDCTVEEMQALEGNELQFLAQHRSATWRIGVGELFISSDRAVKTWNFAGALDFGSDIPEGVALCEKVFADWDRVPCLKVTPLTAPAALAQYLRSVGWAPAVTLVHMVYTGAKSEADADTGVHIAACTTLRDVRLFSEVQSAGFGVPSWVQWVEKVNAINLHRPNQIFYVAEVDGVSAAVCLLLMSGTVGGLYAVATLPTARRHGVARALVRRALRDATDRGANTLCLNTLKGGPAQDVFSKIGFTPVFDSEFYAPSNGAHA